MFQLLLIDDDIAQIRQAEVFLRHAGFHTKTAANGEEALAKLAEQHIDLIILDIHMPVMDGWSFLDTLRSAGDETPVLALSAQQDKGTLYRSFQLGADDFMCKPPDETELLLRIRALLRRAKIAQAHSLTIGGTELRYEELAVVRDGNATILPKKEFQVLFKLLSFPEKTFTRAQLMDEFWAHGRDSELRTVDVHINRIRARFRENPDFAVQTVRGVGYKGVYKKPEGK